jgi:hypothetical protein
VKAETKQSAAVTKPAKTTEDGTERRRKILEEVHPLLEGAHKGDKEVLPKIREALDEAPELARIFVDLSQEAERSLIRHISGDNLLVQEALPRQLEAMRKELVDPNPSPLERLLIERVVASWLQVRYFEAHYAKNLPNLNVVQSEYLQKRIDRAHKRHLSAIRTLAQVRNKLLKPTIAQLNVAGQQINMAGASATSEP